MAQANPVADSDEEVQHPMSDPEPSVKHIVFFITTASAEEGERIARSLLEERLAACVNIVPAVRSFFWWEGKVQAEAEVLLVVKTQAALFEALAARVRSLHSYTVPEIIALPVTAGNPAYLGWVRESVRPAG